MKHPTSVPNLLLFLFFTLTIQAQWLKIPLPGTPRTKDGKPNLTAPAPRTQDGHPDLGGIWQVGRTYTNPSAKGIARFMPPGSKVPLLPHAAKFFEEITRYADAADPSERCLPDGVPNHMLALPIKIIQT